jgi:hypothetical protein
VRGPRPSQDAVKTPTTRTGLTSSNGVHNGSLHGAALVNCTMDTRQGKRLARAPCGRPLPGSHVFTAPQNPLPKPDRPPRSMRTHSCAPWRRKGPIPLDGNPCFWETPAPRIPLLLRGRPMLTALTRVLKPRPLVRWVITVIVTGCLSMSGCVQPDVRAEKAPGDDLSKMSRQLRPRDPDMEPAGLSSRARQIEADLGAR